MSNHVLLTFQSAEERQAFLDTLPPNPLFDVDLEPAIKDINDYDTRVVIGRNILAEGSYANMLIRYKQEIAQGGKVHIELQQLKNGVWKSVAGQRKQV